MNTLLDPAILFFVFGAFAGLVKSNLEIPLPITRFLSLYLLMALGLKGGFALAKSGLNLQVVTSLGIAITIAILVPLIGYFLLKRVLSGFDAAAMAATYGSVSAVTFITATQHLERIGVSFGGYMSAAMALMESPAIIVGVVFANIVRQNSKDQIKQTSKLSTGQVLHEALTDGAQLLLLGAMVVGILTGEKGQTAMHPFSGDLFKGMLSFFLLDMGLQCSKNFREVLGKSPLLIAYAVLAPILHASIALSICYALSVPPGDGALLMILASSASYIAVPAVMRLAVPEANPSIYFGLSLGLTFPINILFGIPFYTKIATQFLR
jgi:uncharacterized protein